MTNSDVLNQYKKIHMLGIGGVSMSGIAEILNHWGFTVTGSDLSDSPTLNRLNSNGIKSTIGHDLDSLRKADLVVYSAAINPNDVEMLEAKKLNIPTMERADFLGEITKTFKNTIGISGTHGKTTTTSLISVCFVEAGLDPNIQVGADLKELNGNYRTGNSDYFILEACEYVESFLKFRPKAEVILNIDNDHLDYFKNLDNIKNAFVKYTKLLPDDGLLVVNADDENCLALREFTKAQNITYGINNTEADFIAKNITFDPNGFPTFDVYYKNDFFDTISLSIRGAHNVLNALAAISVCYNYKISKEHIKNALKKFTGASRRFEFKGKLNNTVSIFDDYAHHPTEITATANALKKIKFNESWVIFQPHTYSRTIQHLDEFAKALLPFDNIIITDIYAAREKNIYGISSKDLADKLKAIGKPVTYLSDFEEIANVVKSKVRENDVIITLGAGTVTQIGPMILK